MKYFALLVVFLTMKIAMAQTVIGKWVTIDDETKKKKSVVELYKVDGKLYGKIISLYPREGREDDPKCKKCSDDRKNKPIIGMQIVRGLKWDGSEWEDGTILDPEIGKIYTVKIWIDPNDHNKLNVRGYIGIFFRTQQWIKYEG
jgi:uncharacterized protein (DUF2147 family)